MKLFYKIFFLLSLNFAFAQSPDCMSASAMCSGQGGPYNNTHPGTPGGNQVGYGSVTGCGGSGSHGNNGFLGSTPRPAWFTYQIGQSGPIELNLQQFDSSGTGIDVDFALWGPFNTSDLSTICTSLSGFSAQTNPANNHPSVGYTGPCNLVDASYNPTYNETIHIPNAITGQIYLLLVTNFRSDPLQGQGTYTINQINVTPSSGSISCDVVCGVDLGPDRILCGAATSVTLTASFLQAPTQPGSPIFSWYRNSVLQYTTPTNSTTVNQSGTWRVSVTRPGCSDVATDDVEVQFIGAVPFNDIGPINAPPGACNPIIDLTSYEAAWVAPYDPASFVFVYFDESANVITNPSAYQVASSTSVFVQINAGPCNINEQVNIIVDCIPPTCSISLTSAVGTNNQIICEGSPITNIVYTTTGSATGATVTGLPTGLTSVYNANTFTISGTPTQTGTFNYTVTTDVCSVNASQSGTITVVEVPAVPIITQVAASCTAGGTSTISNYNFAVTYVFTPAGPGVGSDGLITGMITGTTYTVVASNGTCTSASSASFSNAAVLSLPDVPTISIATPTCSSNGVATITNYVAGLTYVFTPAGPTVGTGGVISGMTVGTNYVVAASNGSCASADSSSFTINAMLAVPATPTISSVAPTCFVVGSSSISNYNGTLVYTFIPAGPSVGAGGSISGMTIGTSYTVTASDGTCSSLASVSFSNLDVLATPVAPTLSVVNSLICSGETAIFQINGTANNVVTYSINGGTNQTVTLTASGSATVEFDNSTTNVVIELSNISNGNCSLTLTESATVTVESCSIPKGISPNGDGLNDNWDLSAYNIKKVEIFNRYGTKVYSKSNYENEWFGQSDSGNELPDGTYYFVIDFTDLETKTGWIYINRER